MGRLVVLGGSEGDGDNSPMLSVETYSFFTKQWTVVQPLSIVRMGHCAVVHKDEIFVIGGQLSGGIPLKIIEVYSYTDKGEAEEREVPKRKKLSVPRLYSSVLII